MIHNLNDGKEHVEEGTFDFIAPDTEQYWRLSGTNDHLDIYFSKK